MDVFGVLAAMAGGTFVVLVAYYSLRVFWDNTLDVAKANTPKERQSARRRFEDWWSLLFR